MTEEEALEHFADNLPEEIKEKSWDELTDEEALEVYKTLFNGINADKLMEFISESSEKSFKQIISFVLGSEDAVANYCPNCGEKLD
jgi:hypothetical protein